VVAAALKSTGAKENGVARGELDDASRQKAEARHWAFYQLHGEPNADAQGPADFN
jgi:pre-mRNA-processing factor 39